MALRWSVVESGPTIAEWLCREVPTQQSVFENPIALERPLHHRHPLKRGPRSW
jgi:hypothetical protein